MNILRVAESTSTLFSKKTNITLIDAETGNIISKHNLDSRSLPESFNKPTIINIEDDKWQILKVEILRKGSYLSAPKLLFHVTSPDNFKMGDNFLVPTQQPLTEHETTEHNTLFRDYTLARSFEQWLQLEFLPIGNTDLIQEANTTIEAILNTPDENNHLLGYSTNYIRNITYKYQLEIAFDDFCAFINPIQRGNISLRANSFIQNGFSLQSANYDYYGIVEDGIIRKLAIQTFNYVDDELTDLLAKYELLFIDWCNASIIAS